MLTGRKLLLADDSLTIQKVVCLTFDDEGMTITAVGSGAAALEHLSESLPDIVLADVFMPEPNGYQLCERIKRDERTQHIPVVLLVGTFEPFNEAEARRVGADEVLTKPFQSIRDLVNKVGGLLGGADEKNTDAERARGERHEDEATQDLSPFTADARAADPAHNTTMTSGARADAYNDFDMDDATIQTTPAAAFDEQQQQQQHTMPAPFSEINEEELFSDRGETEGAYVLSDADAPSVQAHAATAAGAPASATSSAISAEAAQAPESSFAAHTTRAAQADDALLELGDYAPAHGGGVTAAGEADDFILDIGDDDSFDFRADTDPPAAFAHTHADAASAAAEADLFFAENAPVTGAPELFAEPEAFVEPQTTAAFERPETRPPEMSSAEPAPGLLAAEPAEAHRTQEETTAEASGSAMWSAPAAVTAEEDSAPVMESGEAPETALAAKQFESEAAAPVHSDAARVEAESHHGATIQENVPPPAAPLAGMSGQNQAVASSALSPEMMDEVVRRVVARMSEQVVREIAWEVVPDLAERLIKQRLEEEKPHTSS